MAGIVTSLQVQEIVDWLGSAGENYGRGQSVADELDDKFEVSLLETKDGEIAECVDGLVSAVVKEILAEEFLELAERLAAAGFRPK